MRVWFIGEEASSATETPVPETAVVPVEQDTPVIGLNPAADVQPEGSVVPGVVVVVVVVPPIEFAFAREMAPKYPTAGVIPLAACHDASAAFVSEPKYPYDTPTGITR